MNTSKDAAPKWSGNTPKPTVPGYQPEDVAKLNRLVVAGFARYVRANSKRIEPSHITGTAAGVRALLGDPRSRGEYVKALAEAGFWPSWLGEHGDHFASTDTGKRHEMPDGTKSTQSLERVAIRLLVARMGVVFHISTARGPHEPRNLLKETAAQDLLAECFGEPS